jgi:chromate transport protein ChrA
MIVAKRAGSPVEVLLIFLKLGLSCFGGPIAHIGYFRDEFVTRRRWLDEQAYADLVALCQFLPGPASSQVGFSLGLMRAGYLGGAAAWTGFTLPSAILLVLFAYGAGNLHGAIGEGLLHGLKLVAVAIVAQAVWGMARTLCPDRERASIAAIAAVIILFSGSSIAQIGAIAFGALAGLWLGGNGQPVQSGHVVVPVSRTVGVAALTIFFVLLTCLPFLRNLGADSGAALFDAFYRSGALVFGGGHVVLPLLREAFVTPGWVSDGTVIYLRRLSWRRRQSVSAWRAGRGVGFDRHFSSRNSGAAGHVAILGCASQKDWRASDDAWRQCGGRRSARRGALQSSVDQFGANAGRFRRRTYGLRAAHRLAHAAARGRNRKRHRRRSARAHKRLKA